MELLDKAIAFIGGLNGTYLAGAAMVLEMVFRYIPTSKPLSLAHLAGALLNKLGSLCLGLGNLLDKVLPQKVETK